METHPITQLFNMPGVSLMSLIAMFSLGILRLAPVVALAPFLGAKLPGSSKMGLAVMLTIFFLPHLARGVTTEIHFGYTYLGYGLKEVLVGFIIAFMTTIPFYIAESAGTLIDYLRGSSSLMVQDPTMKTQVSPIGLLYNYTLIVLFFAIGGPFIFLGAFMDSYSIIPLDRFLPVDFFSYNTPLWVTISGSLTKILAMAIQLSAPALLAILMAEMFLGIANRLAPQVQIAFLGMPLKSLLGLSLLWAAWFFILQQMGKSSIDWIDQVANVIETFKHPPQNAL